MTDILGKEKNIAFTVIELLLGQYCRKLLFIFLFYIHNMNEKIIQAIL